jgi:tRNA A-37 threonylcarbamoyl transferase component Bud32
MVQPVTRTEAFLGLLEPDGEAPYLLIDSGGPPRWAFPSSTTEVLRSSMTVYTPGTARAVAAWYGARFLVGARLGRLLPGRRRHCDFRLAEVLSAVSGCPTPHFAVASSFDGSRCVVGIIDEQGVSKAFAKVARARDEGAVQRLTAEAEILDRLSGSVGSVRVPRVLHVGAVADYFALTVTGVTGRPGLHPARLGRRRAAAAAEVFSVRGKNTTLGDHLEITVDHPAWARRLDDVRAVTEAVADVTVASGVVHGDFAAWNLLADRGRMGIVDWEQARFDGLPFWDLWHFSVQAAALARSSGALRSIRDAIRGRGMLAETIRWYAARCDVPAGLAPDVLLVYLVTTGIGLIGAASNGAIDAHRALAFRGRLLDEALEALS